jgi:siroheme synthase-like protein
MPGRMRTHPVFLRLEGRPCVVVGGDAAAADKARACAAAGGRVVVVASTTCPALAEQVARGAVRHVSRDYRRGDLAGAFLAYASTRDPQLIARLIAEAERHRVLLNVIDTPDACTFLSPAVLERGDLKIAVGTGGASPALAARLRTDLEARIGPEYAHYVAILSAIRARLGADPARVGERAAILGALLDSPLLDLVRAGRHAAIDALLARVAGNGCSLRGLGVTIGETA